jgi:hypothetical protein
VGFYAFYIPELTTWPEGLAGKTVVVTGVLGKTPAYTVPTPSLPDAIPQAPSAPGGTVGAEYNLTNVKWEE